MQQNRAIVMKALEMGHGFTYLCEEMQKDKDVVMTACAIDGMNLAYAPEEMKKDIEVVMVAVKQNGVALQFAAESLQNNFDVVYAAVSNSENGKALHWASTNVTNSNEEEEESKQEEEEESKQEEEESKQDNTYDTSYVVVGAVYTSTSCADKSEGALVFFCIVAGFWGLPRYAALLS